MVVLHVSAIFYKIFNFSPNDSPSKTMKNVFRSSRYSNFCNFIKV